MEILVTGAAGFIGSHICEHLTERGHKIHGIDNFDIFYSRKYKEFNISKLRKSSQINLYEADIRNKSKLSDIFYKNNIDLVIHLRQR